MRDKRLRSSNNAIANKREKVSFPPEWNSDTKTDGLYTTGLFSNNWTKNQSKSMPLKSKRKKVVNSKRLRHETPYQRQLRLEMMRNNPLAYSKRRTAKRSNVLTSSIPKVAMDNDTKTIAAAKDTPRLSKEAELEIHDDQIYWSFHALDKKNIGVLSIEDTLEALGLLHLSNADYDSVAEYVHVVNDGNGTDVEFEDFKTLVNAMKSMAAYPDEDTPVVKVKQPSFVQQPRMSKSHSTATGIIKSRNPSPERKAASTRRVAKNSIDAEVCKLDDIKKEFNRVFTSTKQRLLSNQCPDDELKRKLTSIVREADRTFKSIHTKKHISIVNNSTVLENSDQLASLILDDLLEDTVQILCEHESLAAISSSIPLDMDKLDDILTFLDKLEHEEHKLLERIKEDRTKDIAISQSIQNYTIPEIPIQAKPPKKILKIAPASLQSIKNNRDLFARHRNKLEASLINTSLKQSDIIELLENDILQDILEDSNEEFENLMNNICNNVLLQV